MSDIVWEDPIGASITDEGLADVPDQLRARPRQWARIATRPTASNAGTLVRQIKEGKGIWTGGVWESKQRKLNAEQVVYARFMGSKGDDGERPPAED